MRRAIYAFIGILILVVIVALPTYIAFGQPGGKIATVTITAKGRHVAPGGGGGGGGGTPPPPPETKCAVGAFSTTGIITPAGLVSRPIVVASFDERLQLIIDTGIIALTRTGAPLNCISINKLGSATLPAGAYITALYDVSPDWATFSPPATLQYTYNQDELPQGVAEKTLVIASYDEPSGGWVKLASNVDTEANVITAKISRFNDFAVFGYQVGVPSPAAFQISSLSISPSEAYSGEVVAITILVVNTGGQADSYQLILKINGLVEATQEVTLDAGASQLVSFITKKGAGTYSVDINGATGAFDVKPLPAPPPPVQPFNWWLIVEIIAAMALVAELFYILRTQKAHGGITGTLSAEVKSVTSLAQGLRPKVTAVARSLRSKRKIKKGKKR